MSHVVGALAMSRFAVLSLAQHGSATTPRRILADSLRVQRRVSSIVVSTVVTTPEVVPRCCGRHELVGRTVVIAHGTMYDSEI